MKTLNILRTFLLLLCINWHVIIAHYNGKVYSGPSNLNIDRLRLIYSWKSLEFDYPNARARQLAVDRKEFIPGDPVPIDVDVIRGSPPKVLITIPRFQLGVPVTLGYVTDRVSAEGNPIIAPYPNWKWNRLESCDNIVSVYRVKVDECGRLWVLDTGKLEEDQICPPKLLVFNTQNNRLISVYRFPSHQILPESLFITPAVDIRELQGQCLDTFVYIADVTGFQLIVYDHRHQRSWNIQNNLFLPNPANSTFNIAGQSFELADGLFGLALSPILANGDRTLHFHSLASVTESWVLTSVIRNSSPFKSNPKAMAGSFHAFKKTRQSQSAAQAMDKNGVLFYGLTSEIALACWNRRVDFGGNHSDIIVVNRETLQFASGLKTSSLPQGREEVWVLTSAFQKVMNGLNPTEVNFRIQAGFADELVRGTKCSPTSPVTTG